MSTLAVLPFNPLLFAKRLKEAGVPEAQAEAEAEVLNEALAAQAHSVSALETQVQTLAADTKRDVEQMANKGDITDVRGEITDVRGEITELRGEITELRGGIAELRAELRGELKQMATKADIAEVRGEIAGVRGDVKSLKWMLGMLITGVFALAAAVSPLIFKGYFLS